jgi:hypothetical protein
MPTRVLFGPMPNLLRDLLVHGFASHADIAVVAPPMSREDSIVEAVERAEAGALVMCSDDGKLPESYRNLIYMFPHLKVVVLTTNGRLASLYRLVLARMRWTEISPQDVVTAIRHRDGDIDA